MFFEGDKVKFKSWSAMKSEFGLNGFGSINCQYCFTKDMKEDIFMHRVYTISELTPWRTILLKEPYTKSGGEYNLSEDMFVHYVEPEKENETIDKDDVRNRIIIESDGKKLVTAVLINRKKVIKKSIAKCHDDDTFDLKIGAGLAVERLFEDNIKKEEKVPYIYSPCNRCNYGPLGIPTKFKDSLFGKQLYTGDIVEVFSNASGRSYGETFIMSRGQNFFAGGCMGAFNSETGEITGFKVVLKKSFRQVSVGDKTVGGGSNVFVIRA